MQSEIEMLNKEIEQSKISIKKDEKQTVIIKLIGVLFLLLILIGVTQ